MVYGFTAQEKCRHKIWTTTLSIVSLRWVSILFFAIVSALVAWNNEPKIYLRREKGHARFTFSAINRAAAVLAKSLFRFYLMADSIADEASNIRWQKWVKIIIFVMNAG